MSDGDQNNLSFWAETVGSDFGTIYITYTPYNYQCKNCKGFGRHRYPYCPHCGFKMINGDYQGKED